MLRLRGWAVDWTFDPKIPLYNMIFHGSDFEHQAGFQSWKHAQVVLQHFLFVTAWNGRRSNLYLICAKLSPKSLIVNTSAGRNCSQGSNHSGLTALQVAAGLWHWAFAVGEPEFSLEWASCVLGGPIQVYPFLKNGFTEIALAKSKAALHDQIFVVVLILVS